jgi:hypothetical protein
MLQRREVAVYFESIIHGPHVVTYERYFSDGGYWVPDARFFSPISEMIAYYKDRILTYVDNHLCRVTSWNEARSSYFNPSNTGSLSTWTRESYSNPLFQIVYLINKLIPRIKAALTLLEESRCLGINHGQYSSFVLCGGGPGIEGEVAAIYNEVVFSQTLVVDSYDSSDWNRFCPSRVRMHTQPWDNSIIQECGPSTPIYASYVLRDSVQDFDIESAVASMCDVFSFESRFVHRSPLFKNIDVTGHDTSLGVYTRWRFDPRYFKPVRKPAFYDVGVDFDTRDPTSDYSYGKWARSLISQTVVEVEATVPVSEVVSILDKLSIGSVAVVTLPVYPDVAVFLTRFIRNKFIDAVPALLMSESDFDSLYASWGLSVIRRRYFYNRCRIVLRRVTQGSPVVFAPRDMTYEDARTLEPFVNKSRNEFSRDTYFTWLRYAQQLSFTSVVAVASYMCTNMDYRFVSKQCSVQLINYVRHLLCMYIKRYPPGSDLKEYVERHFSARASDCVYVLLPT